jgi:RNA recognition motif-containing protein
VPVRLFVGNLPYSTTEAELRAHFAPVAEPLHIVIPVDRDTGRPRGFAFVDVADRAAAEAAIRHFDAQPFKGRPLAVSEARPREPRPAGGPPSRPVGPPDSSVASADAATRPVRAPAAVSEPQRRRKAAPSGRRERWERGPKGPIRERISGRVYDIAEEDDWSGAELTDFDDFATSARADEEPPEPER